MKVEVIPGEILLETIHVTRHDAGVILLHVDCKSKYPEVSGYGSDSGSGDGAKSVLLYKASGTLYTDDTTDEQTEIVVSDVDWLDKAEMIASAARYSVIISITAFDFDKAECVWGASK